MLLKIRSKNNSYNNIQRWKALLVCLLLWQNNLPVKVCKRKSRFDQVKR